MIMIYIYIMISTWFIVVYWGFHEVTDTDRDADIYQPVQCDTAMAKSSRFWPPVAHQGLAPTYFMLGTLYNVPHVHPKSDPYPLVN